MPETEHPNFPLFATRLYSLSSLIGFQFFKTQLPDIDTLGNLQAPTAETERVITAQVHEVLSGIYKDYELQINLSSVTALMESILEIMVRSEKVSVTERSALSSALALSWEVVRRTRRD